ncbi:hypothetical protein SASPL_146960 [Salvia splendens]|uniref:RING-type E3 ubiquitin transferase n=1 Tax=Salvia splendens TaxID=180675 RepID=A0A8X8WDQ8_SALSN|nr:RING-H2 finger protein ATL52-like [Salvia splendens]KAG6392735.1 hypothetical protein SASPL_146960 [Salvia splendens]
MKSPYPIPAALVVSLGIAGAALLTLSYYALRRYASRRPIPPPLSPHFNTTQEFDHVIDHPVWLIRTTGLPGAVIESIPKLRYKKGEEGGIATSDCSVCLSEFEDGDRLRLLRKCGHAFHVACVDTWLGAHTNCPLCRAPVLGEEVTRVESGSSEMDMIGGETEGMSLRRSVSLGFVEANKAFVAKRSISISGLV